MYHESFAEDRRLGNLRAWLNDQLGSHGNPQPDGKARQTEKISVLAEEFTLGQPRDSRHTTEQRITCGDQSMSAHFVECLLHRSQGYAELIINRPAARNALSSELTDALAAHLERLAVTDSVRVVMLRAEGGTFRCGRRSEGDSAHER